jgi:hypothetical protein
MPDGARKLVNACLPPWLPDIIFLSLKSQFLSLGMNNVGIFYGFLEYCVAISYILWPFGILCGRLV